MPDRNLPLIKFTIRSFKGIIADQVPGTMNEGGQDGVHSDNDLDVALHSKVPDILIFWFASFEIFLISIDYAYESRVSIENVRN
jgi:hypothetical protein